MDRNRILLLFGAAWVSAALLTWFLYSATAKPKQHACNGWSDVSTRCTQVVPWRRGRQNSVRRVSGCSERPRLTLRFSRPALRRQYAP